MSSANRDILSTSLPVCIPFISSSCLIALAWNSRTILKRSGESRYPWREAILSGQVDFWILKEKKIGVSMKHKYLNDNDLSIIPIDLPRIKGISGVPMLNYLLIEIEAVQQYWDIWQICSYIKSSLSTYSQSSIFKILLACPIFKDHIVQTNKKYPWEKSTVYMITE
jgi:hypothetical protein